MIDSLSVTMESNSNANAWHSRLTEGDIVGMSKGPRRAVSGLIARVSAAALLAVAFVPFFSQPSEAVAEAVVESSGICSASYSNSSFSVSESGGNCIVTFGSSGTFHATNVQLIRVVAIGGGGGGGNDGGSGGTGGQLRDRTLDTTLTSNVSVAIGGGGRGAIHETTTGSSGGGTSSFHNIIFASGGNPGVRAGTSSVSPASAGSGGGGNSYTGGSGGAGGGKGSSPMNGGAGGSGSS